MTLIIDAHQDIAYNALSFNRDIFNSALVTRENEKSTQIPVWNNGQCVAGWPEYQKGEIAVIFATIFIPPAAHSGGEWETQSYQTIGEAKILIHRQLDYYHRLTEEHPDKFSLILTRTDLESVLSQWVKPDDHSAKSVGLVLLMEGAEAIREPRELEEYYELGLRQVGPVWAGTRFCGGTYADHAFDAEGRELLEVMTSLKIPLDISHMREKPALQALDIFDGVVFASHANARRLLKGAGGERHLTDLVIKRIFERGGCIGVLPYNKFLSAEWTPASPREMVTLEHVADQIDYYCQLAGDADHVGIGSDADGGFGYPHIPYELNTIADLQKLEPVLLKRGYTINEIQKLFFQNWKNHLEQILP